MLNRRGHRVITLWPIARYRSARGYGPWENEFIAELQFHRGGTGAITHFTVSTPAGEESARGLRFVKIAAR